MPTHSLFLLLALSPLAAGAAEPQPPPCNPGDFFTTQFNYTVGRVVDAGPVLLLGEAPGCLDGERAGCHSGDELEPGTSLVIGEQWHDHYCVQALQPGRQVVGWAPQQRVMKTSRYDQSSFSDWAAHWEGSEGRAIDIVTDGGRLQLSVPGAAGKGAPTIIGTATPRQNGTELYLSQGACRTRMSLQSTFLVVSDNGKCPAASAALRGVYRNNAPMERLMRRLER